MLSSGIHPPTLSHIPVMESTELTCSQGLDVVFYGDSIVESWRGTELGVAVERAKGVPDMWGRHFGEPYNAKAFGIASVCCSRRPDTASLGCYHAPSLGRTIEAGQAVRCSTQCVCRSCQCLELHHPAKVAVRWSRLRSSATD